MLTRKNWDHIINLQGKHEMEVRYKKEVQSLYKTKGFGTVCGDTLGTIDRKPLDEIMKTATQKAPLISNMIMSVGRLPLIPLICI